MGLFFEKAPHTAAHVPHPFPPDTPRDSPLLPGTKVTAEKWLRRLLRNANIPR